MIKKIYSFQAPQFEIHSPLIFCVEPVQVRLINFQTAIFLLAITMQDSSDIMILSLQFGALLIPPTDDGFQPIKIQYPILIKWLEQKTNTNQLLPARVKDYYFNCRKQFVEIRQTPQKLTDGNEKAINFLEANTTKGRIAPQVKCDRRVTHTVNLWSSCVANRSCARYRPKNTNTHGR